MIAFMLSMNVDKKKIKTKVRRLLAKSHIGLIQTQWIDNVLDSLGDMVCFQFFSSAELNFF